MARGGCEAANPRESHLSWNERHLTGLDLRHPPANLRDLGGGDIRRNILSKTLHEAVRKFRPLRDGELRRLFKDMSNGLSHSVKYKLFGRGQAVSAFVVSFPCEEIL